MSVANPVAQRGISLNLGTDDTATTATDEPPDIGSLKIVDHNAGPRTSNTLSSIPIGNNNNNNNLKKNGQNVSLLSTSLDTSLRRANASAEAMARLSPIMPHSPSVAESTGGSASDYDYEHEPDSPSSMSSWNSWAGGRRGDLADVEDLELDGVMVGEPELETVSEMDEESSGFVSGSDRPVNESEDDDTLHRQSTTRNHHKSYNNSSEHSPRRKIHRQIADGHHGNGVSPHFSHHASHLHPHGTPIHPHFSPRAGGHGLSHASRHLLRAPPNLAARRRHHHKGRLAELAEEGTGNAAITTTKMPAPKSPEEIRNSPPTSSNGSVSPPENHQQHSPEEGIAPALPTSLSLPNWDNYHINGSHSDNIEMEIFGPPALPVRSVSPSETIPVVPSPLCVCLTADEKGDVTEVRQDLTPTNEVQMDALSIDTPTNEIDTDLPSGLRTPTPPSPSASNRSAATYISASTPTTSPPVSPQLTRKGSGRARRSSSPGRKLKVPLRPCFKRHGTSSRFSSSSTNASGRDSSSEREKGPLRGRTKVRFQQGPPMEIRTHSPVEYDRKACPISNRLSAEDLEELRTMKMEMGLLEAKCAALAAYKSENDGLRSPGYNHHSVMNHNGSDWTESESESESGNSSLHPPPAAQSSLIDRRRADSISSSSPTTFCGNRFAQRGNGKDTNALERMTPAEYLRMEREKERERVCRMAGIGTGVGFRYTGGGPNTRQMPHGGCEAFGASSIISRFGLSKPPPPLPGMVSPCNSHQSLGSVSPQSPSSVNHSQNSPGGYQGGSSLCRPNSAPPARGGGYNGNGNAFPQVVDGEMEEEIREEEEGGNFSHQIEHEDTPRGRSMEKSNGRNVNHNSTSTDATITEFTKRDNTLPSFLQTGPSPPSSNASHSPIRDRSMSPCTTRYDPSLFYGSSSKPVRPGIRPVVGATSSPSYELVTPPSTCGYDSPASEFCYESGSEYDLIG